MKKYLAASMAVLLAAVSAVPSRAADLIFTVTGEATTNGYGYASGEEATFVFVLDGGFMSDTSSFSTTLEQWRQGPGTPLQLVTSITGGGLTGAFDPTESPNVTLSADADFGDFAFYGATSNFPGTVGIVTPNGTGLNGIGFTFVGFLDGWTLNGVPETPEDFLAGSLGVVDVGSESFITMISAPSSSWLDFNVTSATIAVAPEPTITMLLAAGCALVFRRRARL